MSDYLDFLQAEAVIFSARNSFSEACFSHH
jgi:hypothetical protein